MMIRLHLTATLLGLGLGTANLAPAKGTPRHKIFGWAWIAAGGFALMPGRFVGHLLGY